MHRFAAREPKSAPPSLETSATDFEQSFPWLPAVAPVITALVLWVATDSPLSLLFGVMSPVILVAQFFENRRQSRRRWRRQQAERAHAEAEKKQKLAQKKRLEVQAALREFPPAHALLTLLEVARLPSERPTRDATSHPARASNRHSAVSPAHIDGPLRLGITDDGRPYCVDASDGILIEGHAGILNTGETPVGLAPAQVEHVGLARRAVTRAITAQLWWATSDVTLTLNAAGIAPSSTSQAESTKYARWLVTVVSDERAFVLDRDSSAQPRTPIQPDTLSAEDLERLRKSLTVRGQRLSHVAKRRTSLVTESRPSDDARLFDVEVGETSEGHPFVMNLMRDGPHCVVSGMTGSGKTSFIVGWLSRLCAQTTPASLEFAVIDFKGGIDFAAVANYPHCVGFATDLDEGAIDHALLGLEAEAARRERELRFGKRLVDLSRLIVILDEYRAVAAAHPRAVGIMVDLAARGRALGIHLVLSTQRASTSISEDILANVPLRIAFRALTPHESFFLVGDDRAYRELVIPGDAVVASASGTNVKVHFTEITSQNNEAEQDTGADARERAPATTPAVRRLWSDPLPARILRTEAESLPQRAHPSGRLAGEPSTTFGPRLCLGVVDARDHQSWESAWYLPQHDGHLLIAGTARTGRTGTIHALVDSARGQTGQLVTAHIIADEVELWDWFDPRCRRSFDDATPPRTESALCKLVLIDGLEGMMSNLPPDARDELSERFMRALRTSDARTSTESTHNRQVTRFVIACDAGGAWSTRLSPLCGTRLELDTAGMPGRARFEGAPMQVPFVERALGRQATSAVQRLSDVRLTETIVVIDGDFFGSAPVRPDHAAIVARERARDWIERLGEFSAHTHSSAVLVRGYIPPSDARILFRGRTPLPPVRGEQSILLYPDGTYERLEG